MAHGYTEKGFVDLALGAGGGGDTVPLWSVVEALPLTTLTGLTSGSGTWSINTYLQCVVATSTQCRTHSDVPMSAGAMSMIEVEMEIPSSGFTTSASHMRIGLWNGADVITLASPGVVCAGIRGDGQAYFEQDGVLGLPSAAYTVPAGGTWVKVKLLLVGTRYTLYFDDVRVAEFEDTTYGNNSDADVFPYIACYSTGAMTARFRNFNTWSVNVDPDALAVTQGSWEDWIAVDGGIGFSNSWVNYGGGEQAAEYRKHSNGMVQVRGLIKSGTLSASVFTLPTGYRPVAAVRLGGVLSGNAHNNMTIGTGGTVLMGPGSASWTSVDGIEFDSTGGT